MKIVVMGGDDSNEAQNQLFNIFCREKGQQPCKYFDGHISYISCASTPRCITMDRIDRNSAHTWQRVTSSSYFADSSFISGRMSVCRSISKRVAEMAATERFHLTKLNVVEVSGEYHA